jgi:hypothetical protein
VERGEEEEELKRRDTQTSDCTVVVVAYNVTGVVDEGHKNSRVCSTPR